MDIQVAVFDVDSTLTAGPNKPVVQSAVEAIHKLQEKGIKVVIASGRIACSIPSIKGKINPDYYICPDGAAVLDSQLNILYSRTFSFEQKQHVVDYAIQNDMGLLLKYADMNCIVHDNENVKEAIAQMVNVHFCDHPDSKMLPNAASLLGNHEQYLQAKEHFKTEFTCVDGGCWLYDLDLIGVDKRTGLQQLLNHLDLKPENCIGFGDSDNDLEMVKYCGIGVAMGNGFESIKKVADYITDTAANDGIKKALEKYKIL